MRAIVVSTVLALTLLSLWWTTFKSRQIMSRSLGRKLKAGEETSLRSWMEVPEAGLETATTELERIHSNASYDGCQDGNRERRPRQSTDRSCPLTSSAG